MPLIVAMFVFVLEPRSWSADRRAGGDGHHSGGAGVLAATLDTNASAVVDIDMYSIENERVFSVRRAARSLQLRFPTTRWMTGNSYNCSSHRFTSWITFLAKWAPCRRHRYRQRSRSSTRFSSNAGRPGQISSPYYLVADALQLLPQISIIYIEVPQQVLEDRGKPIAPFSRS
jgi:hypothetical protein